MGVKLDAILGKLRETDTSGGGGTGDMTKSVYDPTNKSSDAFNMDNMTQGTNNKYLSSTDYTDLTDGGDTTLHIHDNRYYTETEVNSLIANVGVNFFTLSETVVLNGNTYQQSCTSQTDARYGTAVELTGPTVTGTAIAGGKAVSDAGVITSIPAGPITTHLKVRKISGNADFTFYYEYYKLSSSGTETLLGTSSISDQVHSNTTTEFTVTTILPATTFLSTDRLMRKGFFTKVGTGTDPVVGITVEGADPTYVGLAIPVTSVSFAHNDTTGKQGGTAGEYYHMTSAQNTVLSNTSGVNSGDQNIFASIVVSGQTTVTTASKTQALTLVAGTNVTITTDNTAKSITISASGGGFSWGATATSTSGTGLTMTADNSSSAGTIIQSLIIGDTQTQNVTSLKISTGTANRAHNALIIDSTSLSGLINLRNYSSATQAQSSNQQNGLVYGLNYNTNSSVSQIGFSIYNMNNAGTGGNNGIYLDNLSTGTYTNGAFQDVGLFGIQDGAGGTLMALYGANNVNTNSQGLFNLTISDTQSGATTVQKISLGTSAQGHTGVLVSMANASTSVIAFKADASTTGTGKVLSALKSSTERLALNPFVTDGASAIGYLFDTSNTLSNTAALLASFRNGGTTKAYVMYDGTIVSATGFSTDNNTTAWKFGTVATVTPTLPNRTVAVTINGTTYYLAAKTTND